MSSGIPSWDDVPELWETLEANGQVLPGVVRARVKRGRKWDRKDQAGAHGETQTFKGVKAADVDLTWRFVAADWPRVQELLELFDPPAEKDTPKPIDVMSATLVARRVSHIQSEDVDGPDETSDGIFEIKIKGFEFFEKPSTKNGSGTAKGPLTPCQDLRARVAALQARIVALQNYAPASATEFAEQQSQLFANIGSVRALQTEMYIRGCGKEVPASQTQAGPS